MANPLYSIRNDIDHVNVEDLYVGYPNLFSMELNHGGRFTNKPGRRYVNGSRNYADCIDIDQFSIHEVDSIVEDLGYDGRQLIFYHFQRLNSDLDSGIETLGGDSDVCNLARYVRDHKLISVYIELGSTSLETYCGPSKSNVVIEEINEQPAQVVKPSFRRLLLDWNEEPILTAPEEENEELDENYKG